MIGNMVGSGVYLLPATLAPFGLNALLGWCVSIVGGVCLAYVFARLAAVLPRAGGPYAYADAAFGPVVGFTVAWAYWVCVWVGNGAVAVATVSALSLVWPALGEQTALFALILVWLVVTINIRGVALAGGVQLVTTIVKLLPLVAVVLLAAWLLARHGGGAIAANPAVPIRLGSVAGAAAITFWGFLGVESATVPADKVADAARVVPRATLWGVALTGTLYLLVSAAVAVLMPAAAVAASPAPLAAFLGRSLGGGIGSLVALCAAVSAFGALNGYTLIQGELPRAMAAGGVFPAWMGRIGRRGTPVNAHLLGAGLLTAMVLMNTSRSATALFGFVASVSVGAALIAYLVVALAALRLLPEERALRLVAIVAALFALWMLWGLGIEADLWALVLIAAGLPILLAVRRGRRLAPA